MGEATSFALNVSSKLGKRFPKSDFLEALDILNPHKWKHYHDPHYTAGT